MTIKEIYSKYLQDLQALYSANEASIITDLVFVATAGIQRADLVKNPTLIPADEIINTLNFRLDELLRHKPLQYVLGEAWFYNMRLIVNEHTLIPRPETEELVKLVIDECQQKVAGENDVVKILDIGTGSGCIAIAIKKNLPAMNMTAIDLSSEALLISKENAAAQNVQIDFLQLDFLDELQWKNLGTFSVIVSNPPYIPVSEKEKLDKNVTDFEPSTALFVPDQSPFLFYEKIAAFAKDHLLPGGKIFLEINEEFGKETAAIFSNGNWIAEIKKDMFGKERMIVVG
ncbi:MAG: peptide chain release factor N(5)-glutamine methyltransferase [Ferruginibacter sp.]